MFNFFEQQRCKFCGNLRGLTEWHNRSDSGSCSIPASGNAAADAPEEEVQVMHSRIAEPMADGEKFEF